MASSAADQLSVMSISVKSKQSAEEKKEPEEEIMFCSSCGETGDTLKKCVACKCVFYCGVMCQKAHRDAHKTECKLVKKILKKKEKEFDPWKQTSDPDQREFNDLMEECIDEKLAEFAAKYGHAEEFEGLTFLEKTQALMAITTFDEEKGDEALEGIDSLMGRKLAPSISSIIHDGFVPLNPSPRKCCAACNKMMPPLDNFMTTYVPCCGKIVCTGCATEQADILMESNKKRAMKGQRLLIPKCVLCWEELPTSNQALMKQIMKRVDKNDARAIQQLAMAYMGGHFGLQADETMYRELIHRAADLGNTEACVILGVQYCRGGSGFTQDQKKAEHYWKTAAEGGEPMAIHALAEILEKKGRWVLALQYYKVAAEAGHQKSIDSLLKHFELGGSIRKISHEDVAKALRSRDKACIQMKSRNRDDFAARERARGGPLSRSVFDMDEVVAQHGSIISAAGFR